LARYGGFRPDFGQPIGGFTDALREIREFGKSMFATVISDLT